MTTTNKKQFGVWMDTHHATIIGRDGEDATEFSVIGHAENPATDHSGGHEKTANNSEKTSQLKFFKEITAQMQNAEELHLTGTGTAQEQFIHYLADTPQFKNTVTHESTSNKMSAERLTEFIADKFNSTVDSIH